MASHGRVSLAIWVPLIISALIAGYTFSSGRSSTGAALATDRVMDAGRPFALVAGDPLCDSGSYCMYRNEDYNEYNLGTDGSCDKAGIFTGQLDNQDLGGYYRGIDIRFRHCASSVLNRTNHRTENKYDNGALLFVIGCQTGNRNLRAIGQNDTAAVISNARGGVFFGC